MFRLGDDDAGTGQTGPRGHTPSAIKSKYSRGLVISFVVAGRSRKGYQYLRAFEQGPNKA